MGGRPPWFPFYIGDFVRDTLDLSAEEIGCYTLLLCHYYAHGKLPHSSKLLARIARVPEAKWPIVAEALAPKFQAGWVNTRALQELEKQDKIRAARRAAGRKGGLKTQAFRSSNCLSKSSSKAKDNHNHIDLYTDSSERPVAGVADPPQAPAPDAQPQGATDDGAGGEAVPKLDGSRYRGAVERKQELSPSEELVALMRRSGRWG